MADTMVENQKPIQVPDIKNITVNETETTASSTASAHSVTDTSATPATEENKTTATEQPPLSSEGNHVNGDANAQDGPFSVPFSQPLPHCKPEPRADLTAEQATKYDTVLAAVKEWTHLPTTSAKNAPTEPITEDEQMWLTRDCLLRYLRATSWNTTNAMDRLKATLVWRKEYGVEKLTPEYISPEMETGKECVLGFDIHGRPCLYMDPGKQNTKKSDRQIEAMVYMLERVIDMIPPGQETTALLINFKNATSSGSPSVGQGRQTLTILQGHYPERLGRACVSDLPWYISTFFKLISPFIDPVTKSKIVFNQPLKDKHVPGSQLWKDYGGDAEFVYDHDKYWPALTAMCAERREKYKERWIQGGKCVGEHEEYLRGGEHQPLKDC